MARRPTPVTIAERQRIATDLRAGMSRNDVMRKYGRGASVVTGVAKSEGISLKREMTAAATDARAIDLRERLAIEAEGFLEDIKKLRARVFAPAVAWNFGGKDNTFAEHDVPEPSHADKAKLYTAVGILTDKILRVTATETPGSEEAKGMIVDLVEAAQGFVDAQKAKAEPEAPEA